MAHEHEHHDDGHGHSHGAPADLPADDVAECPVMVGSTSVKADAEAAGLVRDYEGKRYWLCCNSCAEEWDADPAAFAAA